MMLTFRAELLLPMTKRGSDKLDVALGLVLVPFWLVIWLMRSIVKVLSSGLTPGVVFITSPVGENGLS